MARLWARLRSISFDSWLFAGMMAFVSAAVAAGLYVSYTSLRYVAEVIGGMPTNVSVAFPLTIDAAVAAGLLGEWWLAGRRQRERLAFGYMIAFGLVFAALTVGGNALHGALALTVQRPVELHIGGMLVPLPWWIPIAVSAIPGLAIAGAGFALSLVVSAWRHERIGGGTLSPVEAASLRQQLAEAAEAVSTLETELGVQQAARERTESALTDSQVELRQHLAEAVSAGEAARSEAASARAARERAEEVLASKVEAAALLERELAETRADADVARAARERAEKLLASRPKATPKSRAKAARPASKNGAGGHAHERGGNGPASAPPSSVASNGHDDSRGAHEQSLTALVEAPVAGAEPTMSATSEVLRPTTDGDAHGHAREQAHERPEPVADATDGRVREHVTAVAAGSASDEPEPPDDRPHGGGRRARNGARERARGGAHGRTARVSGDDVRAMVVDARQQLLAEDGEAPAERIAELVAERGHPAVGGRLSGSRVRGYLAVAKQLGELDSAFPAPRPRVLSVKAAAPAAAAKEA